MTRRSKMISLQKTVLRNLISLVLDHVCVISARAQTSLLTANRINHLMSRANSLWYYGRTQMVITHTHTQNWWIQIEFWQKESAHETKNRHAYVTNTFKAAMRWTYSWGWHTFVISFHTTQKNPKRFTHVVKSKNIWNPVRRNLDTDQNSWMKVVLFSQISAGAHSIQPICPTDDLQSARFIHHVLIYVLSFRCWFRGSDLLKWSNWRVPPSVPPTSRMTLINVIFSVPWVAEGDGSQFVKTLPACKLHIILMEMEQIWFRLRHHFGGRPDGTMSVTEEHQHFIKQQNHTDRETLNVFVTIQSGREFDLQGISISPSAWIL